MKNIFKQAHVLAREIADLHAVGAKVPLDKTQRLRHLMDTLAGYAVLSDQK